MRLYGQTDRGLQRQTNQDAFYYCRFSDDEAFAVVCDGMGGANAGNVASETAVKIIANYMKKAYRPNLTKTAVENVLRSSVRSANVAIFEAAQNNQDMSGMGTTAVLAFVSGDSLTVLHVGDSRAYLFAAGELQQLTVDHSVVQTLVDSGRISPDEAKNHPQKNIITRALGVAEDVAVDVNHFVFDQGAVLLLCSDGLSNYVSEDVIVERLLSLIHI